MGRRVLIIEDEPGIRLTLEDRLTAEGWEVATQADGVAGEEAALEAGPWDLVLLDIMLPRRDGLTVCRNLTARNVAFPILMLTARNTDFDVVQGLRQGADDYLAKPFDMEVLLARMDALVRRRTRGGGPPPAPPGNPGGIHRFGAYILDTQRGLLMDQEGRELEIHAQEYRLLCYLVTHPGKVLSRDELLDEVWDYGADVSTRTVDVHVAKLRQRLGESDLPRHIVTIRNRGYRFDP